MKVNILKGEGVTRLEILEERLDVQNCEELKEKLLDILKAGQDQIIVDLKNVDFIDSSGLGALVFGLRRAKRREGELKITGLRPQVRSMFEITRLHRIFKIIDWEDHEDKIG